MFTIPKYALRNRVKVEDYIGSTGDGTVKYGEPRTVRCRWRANMGVRSAKGARTGFGAAWLVTQYRKRPPPEITVDTVRETTVTPDGGVRAPEQLVRRVPTETGGDIRQIEPLATTHTVGRGGYIPLESRVTYRDRQYRVTRVEELENGGWSAPTYLMVSLKDWGEQ